jgi:tetratricopeptide (TPR) repeat protein
MNGWKAAVRGAGGWQWLVLAGAAGAFYQHCRLYEYVQDDAYISFTYAQNLAAGKGLVFNVGERVEGYTNFLWTLLMAVPHFLGMDVVAIARVLGFAASLGILLCCLCASRRLARGRCPLFDVLAPVFIAANGALAFWTLCGMETPLFAFLITLGAQQYLEELATGRVNRRVGMAFGLAALTRPEGILFFAITLLHRSVVAARSRQFSASEQILWCLPFIVPVGAHFCFRYFYYDAWLPNTFYAKTGLGVPYLKHGLLYTQKYLLDYGLWGAGFIAPLALVFAGRSRGWFAYVALMMAGNALYVIAVGGDAWLENRFYLATAPLMYLALQESIFALYGFARSTLPARFGPRWLAVGLALFLAGGIAYRTYAYPRPSILHSRQTFVEHNRRLFQVVDYLNSLPQSQALVVATGTIGITKYFTGARVVDILGLTDAQVARQSRPIPGLQSPEGEMLQRYNVEYAMDQEPDYVFFITGAKPVKAAEKALFLSQRFRRNYYLTYIADEYPLFARKTPAPPATPERIWPRAEFVEYYIQGLNDMGRDWLQAAAFLKESIATGPGDFAYGYQALGQVFLYLGQLEEARIHFKKALAIDDHCVKAYLDLAYMHIKEGEFSAALPLARQAREFSPHSQRTQLIFGLAALFAEPQQASQALTRAVELPGPNRLEALFYLGLAHKRNGDLARARALWQEVLRENPEHQEAKEALAQLPSRG